MTRLATYTGPLTHLQGKRAMIRDATHGHVVAQFDDPKLRRSGEPWPTVLEDEPHARFARYPVERDEPPWDALGYGWHAFPADQFTED